MYTYTEYFNDLDWEFQQVKDGGDTASADKFRKLPSTEAKRYINDTIKELVGKNYERFEKEIIFRFFDSSTAIQGYEDGYYNIDINDINFVSGYMFILPKDIAKLIAYKQVNGVWTIAADSSLANASIYSPAHNKLYNEDGWEDGDTLTAKIIQFPEDIKETISAIAVDSVSSVSGVDLVAPNAYLELVFLSDPGFNVGDTITLAGFSLPAINGNQKVIYKSSDALSYVVDVEIGIGLITPGTAARNYEGFNINWPDEYTRLLTLELKRKVYGRIGKAMSESDWYEYTEIKKQWMNDTGRMKQKSFIAFKGYGFGK